MFAEQRLSVLKIPRRQHAGKASVENVDMAFEKEQVRLQSKIRAKSDAINSYEYSGRESRDSPLARPVPQSPLGKMQSPMASGTPVRILVDASSLTPRAVPEDAEVTFDPDQDEEEEEEEEEMAMEEDGSMVTQSTYSNAPTEMPAAGKHTRLGSHQLNLFSTEPMMVPVPSQHNRLPSDSLNLFRTDMPQAKPTHNYKVQPPFATHDEKARAAKHTAVVPPYATVTDSTAKPNKKADPISFPWEWKENQ